LGIWIVRRIPTRAAVPKRPVATFVCSDLTADVAEDRATAVAIHSIAAVVEPNDELARGLGTPLVVALEGGILEKVGLLLITNVLNFHAVVVRLLCRNLVHPSAFAA
jgi:hypothetical protein